MMKIGMSRTVSVVVNESNTAAAVGSGDTRVFATPMMVALMENAASTLAAESLEEGQTTVGIEVQVSHVAATPVGMTVEATATLTAAEGRTLTFSMEARDERGVIGTGHAEARHRSSGTLCRKSVFKAGKIICPSTRKGTQSYGSASLFCRKHSYTTKDVKASSKEPFSEKGS